MLEPVWTSPGLGDADGVKLWFVPESSSIYTTTGWAIGHAAIAFHRFDLTTGEQLAKIRTRSRDATQVMLVGGDLVVTTDKRLWALDPMTLEERSQYDIPCGYPSRMAADEHTAAVAGWIASTLVFVDRLNGHTVKRRLPRQPTIVRLGGEWCAFSAAQRGRRIIDLEGRKLVKGADCDPVHSIVVDPASGRVWGRSVAGLQEPTYVRGPHVFPIDHDGPTWTLADDEFTLVVDGEHLWTATPGKDVERCERTTTLRCLDADNAVVASYHVQAMVHALDLATRSVIVVGGSWGDDHTHWIGRYELP